MLRAYAAIPQPIMVELLGMLNRGFSRDAEALAHVAVFLSETGTLVKLRQRLRVVTDEPESAVARLGCQCLFCGSCFGLRWLCGPRADQAC